MRAFLHIIGVAGAGLALALAATTNLILIGFGGCIWAIALYYGAYIGIDRIREWKLQSHTRKIALMAALLPFAAVYIWGQSVRDGYRGTTGQSDRGKQFEAAVWLSFGFMLWGVGTFIMLQGASLSQVLALIFGPICFGVVWGFAVRLGKNWDKWKKGGYRRKVLGSLAGLLFFAFAGIFILAVAL